MCTTIAITPQQERILDAINARLDQLRAAASPRVTGILAAAHRLPPADRTYAPIPEDDDVAQLRTDVIARLLVERLTSLGPMSEAEAVDVLDVRAPGRGRVVVNYALHVGLVRRIAGEDNQADALEAVGRPSRTLAA